MKKEMKTQRTKLDKEESRREREKEEERSKRQKMLAAFEDERKQQELKARSK